MHEPGDVVGGVGVAVVLDALDEAARAVPDAGDCDTNSTTHACPLLAPHRGARPLGPRSPLAGIPGSLRLTHAVAPLLGACPSRVSAAMSDSIHSRSRCVDCARCSNSERGVPVASPATGAPGACEPVAERGPAALEQREPGVRLEVTAEDELQRERALVVGRVVGQEQLVETRLAAFGDAVRLAPATAGLARAPQPRGREVAVERPGRGDRAQGRGRLDDLDRALALEPAQSRVERSVGDPHTEPRLSPSRFRSS